MRLDEGEHMAGRPAGRWLDVKQAAEQLGISTDAVRKRIARESLRSAKDVDGSVLVWLDSVDERRDSYHPHGWTEAEHRPEERLDNRLDDLVHAKDDALRDLRDQLEHMHREAERKDTIIMQMAQANAALAARVPELEAPRDASPEPREASETSSEGAGNAGTPDRGDDPGTPWWRRIFSAT
jgi:hypothetical protein